MTINRAEIVGIMTNRLPDNCLYDCPFVCDKRVYDTEIPYCVVIKEFVHDYDDEPHPECPLIEDDVSDKQDSDARE